MPMQSGPRWNKILLSLEEAEELMKKSILKIRLGKPGNWAWGRGAPGRGPAEVESYGNTREGQDEGIKQRETMLPLLKYDIDQAWRRLNFLLGKEPFSAPGASRGER